MCIHRKIKCPIHFHGTQDWLYDASYFSSHVDNSESAEKCDPPHLQGATLIHYTLHYTALYIRLDIKGSIPEKTVVIKYRILNI